MNNKPTYFKNLDALRCFAVMVVFLFHYYSSQPAAIDNAFCRAFAHAFGGAGYLGVDFFFTLSGFLITAILIRGQGFQLGRFYERRALRIVPLYTAIVVLSYFVLPRLLHQELSLPPVAYVLSFSANFFYAVHGDHYLFAITLLWSISVEMQFYLLWGAALRYLHQYVYLMAGSLILASLLVKYLLMGHSHVYFVTATYVPDFMIGAIGAKLLQEGKLNFSAIPRALRLLPYLAVIAVFICSPYLRGYFWWKMCFNCVFALPVMGVILDQCSDASLLDLGKSRLLSYLGRVSYGIYCFQGFVLPLYSRLLQPHCMDVGQVVQVLVVPVLLFALTSSLAALSYRWFESYFLRLKETAHK